MDSDRAQGASCTGLAGKERDRIGERQALVIVGESTLEQVLDKAGLKADNHVANELNTSAKDIDKVVQQAATEVS